MYVQAAGGAVWLCHKNQNHNTVTSRSFEFGLIFRRYECVLKRGWGVSERVTDVTEIVNFMTFPFLRC